MSVLKSCYNGRQIPIILPLSVNGKIIQTLKKKQTFLTNIFCLNVILYQVTVCYQKITGTYYRNKLSFFDTEDKYIYKIIKTPDVNKALGYDEVFIRMLKLCDKGVVKPLSILFKNCKLKKVFPNLWEKANVVPIHKK